MFTGKYIMEKDKIMKVISKDIDASKPQNQILIDIYLFTQENNWAPGKVSSWTMQIAEQQSYYMYIKTTVSCSLSIAKI